MWGKKKEAYRIQTPSAREHLMWKRFMMYTTLGTSDWKMVEADIKKKKKNAGGGESTIIQKHHHQNGKRILLRIEGHSDPSRRWVSNRYGNQPYLFQAHPSLWGLTQWVGTKKFPGCFPQKVLDSESLDFIHRSNSKVLEDRGTWFESLFSFQ